MRTTLDGHWRLLKTQFSSLLSRHPDIRLLAMNAQKVQPPAAVQMQPDYYPVHPRGRLIERSPEQAKNRQKRENAEARAALNEWEGEGGTTVPPQPRELDKPAS